MTSFEYVEWCGFFKVAAIKSNSYYTNSYSTVIITKWNEDVTLVEYIRPRYNINSKNFPVYKFYINGVSQTYEKANIIFFIQPRITA